MPLHEYRILEKMAVGSFGMVFRIQRILDDAILVMKRIPLEDLDAAQRHEAAQEMHLMTELHHPYIVTQRDAFLFNENDLCLIMDYYDGGDLEPVVIDQRESDEYFPFQQVMLWFAEMLLATHYLHSHDIVHRDLKTRNLFLDRKANAIAVGDFGIAEKIDTSKIATWRNLNNTRLQRLSSGQLDGAHASPTSAIRRRNSASVRAVRGQNGVLHNQPLFTNEPEAESSLSLSRLRRTPEDSPVRHDRLIASSQSPLNPFYLQSPEQLNQAMRGTPLYMAPEALQGGHVGPKADVWSLGCILYELLTLRHPFDSRDIGGLVMRVTQGMREPLPSHYPAEVHTLMDAMLAIDARSRPSCEEILQTPLVKAYVELLLILRVPSTVPTDPTEQSLTSQLRGLGVTVPSSAAHAAGTSGGDEPAWPSVLAYTRIEQAMAPPLNPPSVEHKLARQHLAEMLAGAGTMYASASAESSVSSSAFPMGAGTFFTAGAPLVATPSPERGSTSTSRLSIDPAAGLSNPAIMVPTASMRPFMIYDTATSPDGHTKNAARRSTGTATRSVSAAAAAAAAAANLSPLTPLARLHSRSKEFTPDADADRFYAAYANVVDMRDKPTEMVAAEVDALREAVQTVLRQKKQRGDGAVLQERYGSGVTRNMPVTTGTARSASTTATTGTMTTTAHGSTTESPSNTRVVGGTRVYYNNLYSCLVRQQRLALANVQLHDSMPVSLSARSIIPAAVPATSDGVHGRVASNSARSASSGRSGRLGASSVTDNGAQPTAPGATRTEAGFLRRALFSHGDTVDSSEAVAAAPQQGDLAPSLPDLEEGPPTAEATGTLTGTRPLRTLKAPPAYLARRERLLQRVSERLESAVWQAVYWYYRDTNVLQRDPRTVMGWVPDRQNWKVLPLIDQLVVLDRYLVSQTGA